VRDETMDITFNEEELVKEVMPLIKENFSKYSGKMKVLTNQDADLLKQMLAESFLLGFNYGINKVKEITK
jgi:hypothetical protein